MRNANTHTYNNSHTNSYSYCNTDRYAYSNHFAQCDSDPDADPADAHTKAAAHAIPSADTALARSVIGEK